MQLLVHLNKSARADLHLGLVQAGNFRIRFAPHRHQNFVEDFFALLDFGAVESHANAVAFVFHGGHRGVQHDGSEAFFNPLVQGKNQIAVGAGQQAGKHLNHGNFRAQRRIHRAQLQADVAAADHQQSARHLAEIQRGGGIHDSRGVQFEGRNDRGTRAGRKDDAIESQAFIAAGGFRNPQRIRILKRRASLDVFDFALLRKDAQAAGQLLDHAFFPGTQAGQIDFGVGVLDSPIFRMTGFIDQLGHVQQGFRRNAAAVETDSARIRFRIDQRDFQPEIGGQKCRGITTRPAAHHCDMQV